MMHNLINWNSLDLQKVKKSGPPLPTYLIHLYFANELLLQEEAMEYDRLRYHQKFEGRELQKIDSSNDPDDIPTPIPSTLAKKKSQSVDTETG